METIRPSADLRNHYAELSKLCRETRQPIHVTVNGRADTVLLGASDYAQIKAELELLRALSEAEEDVRNNRTSRIEDTFEGIRAMLNDRSRE